MDEQNVARHSMDYYSSLHRKEILIQATIWMGFEDIVLKEISQSQKINSV
jgi:hypothetical protein